MKTLKHIITEKLILNKSTKQEYHYHPKNQDELRSIIIDLLDKRGKNASLNDIDVNKITDMSKLFFDLDPHNIDISKWNVSNVEDMSEMFFDCKNFNSDISEWDVSKIKDMNMMFYGCKHFNCDLSKWDVSNVTDMSGMFYKCQHFNCDLSNWDVDGSVTEIIHIFDGCTSLKNIPDWYWDA